MGDIKHKAVRWKDPLNGHKTHSGLDYVERKLLFSVWKEYTGELRKGLEGYNVGIPQFRCEADSGPMLFYLFRLYCGFSDTNLFKWPLIS